MEMEMEIETETETEAEAEAEAEAETQTAYFWDLNHIILRLKPHISETSSPETQTI